MGETEGDSYKVSSGKKHLLLLKSPLAVPHGCPQMSWHLTASPVSDTLPGLGRGLSHAGGDAACLWASQAQQG